jgi:hypothetical protein
VERRTRSLSFPENTHRSTVIPVTSPYRTPFGSGLEKKFESLTERGTLQEQRSIPVEPEHPTTVA